MSITDELREYASTQISPNRGVLLAIADRIDAEHGRILRETGEKVVSEWIPLPVDADGVPIRIGDVMEWCDSGETLEVVGIGDDCLFYMDGEEAEWTAARNKRHHKQPTVEDVLREFGIDWEYESDCEDRAVLLAEYAAKLRLAEEVDG